MMHQNRTVGILLVVAVLVMGNVSAVSSADRGEDELSIKARKTAQVDVQQSVTPTLNSLDSDPGEGGDLFGQVSTNSTLVASASLFSGGGSTGSSSSFKLGSALSQFAVGNGTYGSGSRADHGFWYVIGGLAISPCCGQFTGGVTGNTNCDAEGRRDIIDITTLIDHVYITGRELCCLANGNLDPANGELINLADITRLIDHVYISHNETPACQ